jgi:hypothetical protein
MKGCGDHPATSAKAGTHTPSHPTPASLTTYTTVVPASGGGSQVRVLWQLSAS